MLARPVYYRDTLQETLEILYQLVKIDKKNEVSREPVALQSYISIAVD